jgi:hypothetical protein
LGINIKTNKVASIAVARQLLLEATLRSVNVSLDSMPSFDFNFVCYCFYPGLVPRELYIYGSLLLNKAFRKEALAKDRYKKNN